MINQEYPIRTMEEFEKILFSDEAALIPGKSKIIYDKAQKYKEACDMLGELSWRGILDFEADDPLKAYFLHCINIKWNFENGYPEVSSKEVIDILSRMDSLLLDNEGISGEWQLSSTLYVMCD